VTPRLFAETNVVKTAKLRRLDELTPAAGGHHDEAQMSLIER
jgi:hypothetical protein